jgi:hypothetical protein
VGFLQVGDGEVQILLGGVEVHMAQHLLNVADVGAVADHVGRARMAIMPSSA